MQTATALSPTPPQPRGNTWLALPVYLMCAAVPISMAATSIAKVLIVLAALVALLAAWRGQRTTLPQPLGVAVPWVMAFMAALAFAAWHTDSRWELALTDFAKYGKLLLIPMVLVLLPTPQQCRTALWVLIASQTLVVVSSLALGVGVVPPWVTPRTERFDTLYGGGSVFTIYLDQGLMTAVFAGMCLHLRSRLSRTTRSWDWVSTALVTLAVLAFLNVLVVLPGRTAHIAMLAVASWALWSLLPKSKRWGLLAIPLVVLILAKTPTEFASRMGTAVSESQDFKTKGDATTSSGIRLNFWRHSISAIQERPLAGYGLASWSRAFLQHAGPGATLGGNERSNPHNEYLQMGVQLGVGGIVLLVGLMLALVRDAWRFAPPERHALISAVIVFAVACGFNSSLYDALIGDYFCLVLGLLLALGLRSHTSSI